MKLRLALVFLVLLRLAIGWHFAVEAVQKQISVWTGETATNKVWTSEPYFREGQGPVAKLVQSRIGDTDDLLLERLSVPDPAGLENPSRILPHRQMPPRLEREWDDYLERFSAHHGLSAEQKEQARAALRREKDQFADWLTARPGGIAWLLTGQWLDSERTPFTRTYPGGTYEANVSVAERVAEYRQKLNEYRGLGERSYALGRDVDKARRPALRAEVAALRAELQGLLDKRNAAMKKALADAVLTKEQIKEKGPVPEPAKHWLIGSIDYGTRWGLLVIGACLLLGLFSRAAALGGAVFLLLTVLTHPSLPWLPVPPNSEGNYLFVSKNVIEMLALFVLACVPSGRWFGLDGIIHALNPFRKKAEVER